MDPKPRPNRRLYLDALRRMTPEQRAAKFFELSAFTKTVLKDGLRQAFPHLNDSELHALYLRQLSKCHNRNY